MPLRLIASLIASALVACATPRSFAPSDELAVRGVLDAQRLAWNRGDLEGYMAGYLRSAELVFTAGGKLRRGWQETFDKYRARYGSDRATMGHLEFAVLAVQPLGADGAIVLGRWTLTDTPAAGGGIFSVALARTPDGWRIVHDHTSADERAVAPDKSATRKYAPGMSDLDQRFVDAQARVKPVTGLGNDTMLDLYALYKQATTGDATGSRPGMLDLRGRAKFDAWASRRGTTRDAAKEAYIALVARVVR